jgi:hypothetical protein
MYNFNTAIDPVANLFKKIIEILYMPPILEFG